MRPFGDTDTHTVAQSVSDEVVNEIRNLDNEYVLKSSETELEKYYVDRALIEPLTLDVEARYKKSRTATQVDVSHDRRRAIMPGRRAIVPGTQLKLAIPFSGDQELWKVRASTWDTGGFPDITISGSEIIIEISFTDDSSDSDMLKREIDQSVESLSIAIDRQTKDIEKHNRSAPNRIIAALSAKREQSISALDVIAELGIPMQRSDATPAFAVPAKRKQRPVHRPAVDAESYSPEPVLLEEEYVHILEIIRICR